MLSIQIAFVGSVLEIGGGNNPLYYDGGKKAVNMDILDSPLVDVRHDASVFPWPVEAESFDNVYSGYCLEHVPWKDVRMFVSEMYRVLKKGGAVVLFTSNTLEQCKWVVEHGVSETASQLLFGGQEFPGHGGCHKNCLSPEWATKLFEEAGFVNIRIIPHPATSTDMLIEARKGAVP